MAFDVTKDTENQDEEDNVTNNKKTDRIDILLYDNKEKQLLFCEAKHFSNSEIWAEKGNKPQLITQLKSYDNQIDTKKERILKAYTTAFEEYNQLMGTNLQPPHSICEKCGLLIFDFDNNQKNKIKELLIDDESLAERKYKMIGNIFANIKNTNTVENLFKSLK